MNPSEILLERVETLRQAEPRLRARELAARLGVTELEVVACRRGADVQELDPEITRLFKLFSQFGPAMALTRNETVVHERRGVYGPLVGGGPARVVSGPDIDLRVFPAAWVSAWAVTERSASGARPSVQVFDRHGVAVHKVYFEGEPAVFEALIGPLVRVGAADGALPQCAPPEAPVVERPDDTIPRADFQAAWRALEDPHGFFGLLRRFGVGREQALRLGPPEMVSVLPVSALEQVLRGAAAREISVMVFVGNPGNIQIHTGPVSRIVPTPGWLNVLDPSFNLHVRLDRLRGCWRVLKPSEAGPVSALEVFDTDGTLCVQVFGERKPGRPQDPSWVQLMGELEVGAAEAHVST